MNNRKILKYVSLLVSLMVAACAPNVLADKDKENAITKNEESGSTSTQNRKQTEVLEEQNSKQQTKEKQKLEKNKKEKEKKPENKNKKNKVQKKKKTKKEETEIKKEEKKEVEIKKDKDEKDDVKDLTKKKEKNLEKETEKKDLKENDAAKSKGERETKKGEKKEEKFKEFNRKDYENMPGFNLVEVLEKNGCHFLDYVNKTTKSHCVLVIFKNPKDLEGFDTGLLFRAPATDDRGLRHMLEHVISLKIGDLLQMFPKVDDIKYATTYDSIIFQIKSSSITPELFCKILEEFKDPTFLKDGGEIFRREVHDVVNLNGKKIDCGRVYFEELRNIYKFKTIKYLLNKKNYRLFDTGGDINAIKKATVEDVKKVMDKYIHPSNSIFICGLANEPEKAKAYLKEYDSWCSFYGGPKEYNLKDVEPKFKNYAKFQNYKLGEDSDFFTYSDSKTNSEKQSKYVSKVHILVPSNLNARQRDVFIFSFTDFLNLVDKKKLKEMGYLACDMLPNPFNFNLDGSCFILYGNDKDSFAPDILKKNCKELLKGVVEKIKKLSKKERYNFYNPKNPVSGKRFLREENLKKGFLYRNFEKISSKIYNSFLFHSKPFSQKFLDIENGKIVNSEQRIIENIEKNLDCLDIYYKALDVDGLTFFDIYENDETKKSNSKRDETLENFFEMYYKLPTKDRFLHNFVSDFFVNKFINSFLSDKGFLHSTFNKPLGCGLPFCNIIPKENRDLLKNYFQSKTFKKDLKNFKISEEDFEKQKESFKALYERLKTEHNETKKNFLNILKKCKDHLNNLNEKELYDFSFQFISLSFSITSCNLFDSEKEFLKYEKFEEELSEKQKKLKIALNSKEKISEAKKRKDVEEFRTAFKKFYKYFYKEFKKCGKKIDEMIEYSNGELKNLSLEKFLKILNSIKIKSFKEGKDVKCYIKSLY